jgi:thiol:disulfide interchange protein
MLALLLLLLGITPAAAAESPPVATARTTATLVSEADSIGPAGTLRLALRLRVASGWHTYWRNPGDSGAPPTLDLTLPAGATAGPLAYPPPARDVDGPITSYVLTGDVLLPERVEHLAAAGATIRAHATWLVCASVCVPEQGDFALTLPAGPGGPGENAPLFAAFDRAAPRPSPFPAHVTPQGTLWLQGAGLDPAHLRTVLFFPNDPGRIDQGAPQKLGGAPGLVTLALAPTKDFAPAGGLQGVLTLTDATGETAALALDATQAPLPAAAPAPTAAAPAGSPAHPAEATLPRALLLAFLGGLILNLMPCVLPVLAMKALTLARLSAAERGHVRREALLYTAGVLAAFLAIGGAIAAARIGGSRLGWGIQFQSAVFTTAMAWLLLAIGLNLSGVFEIGTRITGAGASLASRGSFFTGLLAVVVATPCTAPFMGAALAAAAAMPILPSLAIFAALGAGLAAPTLLLAVAPGLAGALPRPGPWMLTLRQLLAFPMYGAALWLVWVAAQQTGPTGLVSVLAGGLLIAFAAWAWGRDQAEPSRLLRATAVAALALVAAVGGSLAVHPPVPAAAATTADAAAQRFSPTRLAALRAERRPVFVDMTAAWCVTCLVNERVALDTAQVRAAFARHRVAYLRGDWTRRDPDITAFLREHDRDGVPLYVYYPPGGSPEILPQILTEAEILSRLDRS